MEPRSATFPASGADQPRLRVSLCKRLFKRRGRTIVEIWCLTAVGLVAYAFAYALEQDLRKVERAYLVAVHAAFMIRTFQFHVALFYLAMLGITVALRHCILSALVGCFTLFLFWPSMQTLEGYVRPAPAIPAGIRIRVLSVNLRYDNANAMGVLDELARLAPDLALFQEYTEEWHDLLHRALASEYPHVLHEARKDAFGLAVYSRFPFVGNRPARLKLCDGEAPQFRCEIDCGGDRLAVYNVHLLPPTSLGNIAVGRQELADLCDLLRDEPLPYIVGGDFNFTQTSPQAWKLWSQGLKEAFQTAGKGAGATWPVHPLLGLVPGLRLDHLYFSPPLACVSCRAGRRVGSDHRPVIGDFHVPH